MALVLSDRVKETSVTSGTGSVTLTGAFGGFVSFSTGIGTGNTTYYAIENDTRWEIGIGTYTSAGNSLSRDTVLGSSSSGSKITLDGLSIVFCTYPASRAIFKDASDDLDLSSTDIIARSLSATDVLTSGLSTFKRVDAGSFFHAYVDDANDRTIALYSDATTSPEWKLGLKTSPSDATAAPTYAYIYAEDASIGLVGDSLNRIDLQHGPGFVVTNKGNAVFKATSSTGVHINATANAYPALTVNGGVSLASDIQRWSTSAGTVLSAMNKDGSLAINKSSASYQVDVKGSGRFTSVIFNNDATEQSTAYTNQEVAVSGWAKAYVDSQDHSGEGGGTSPADLANSASGVVISGIANTNSIAINNSGTYWLGEIRANSASGVVISGIAAAGGGGGSADTLANSASGVVISGIANSNKTNIATNVTNITSNLVEIRTNSASGNTNLTNIASNLVEIRTNSASGNANLNNIASNLVEIRTNSSSGNTNLTNIASNLVEIRTNSSSGNTNLTNIASNLVEIRANSASGNYNLTEIRANSASGVVISGIATYTAGNGLLLTGSVFTLDDPANGTSIDEGTIATDDRMPIWDETASSWKYVTIDNLQDEIDTGGGGGGSTADILANSASGVVISGIANTNKTNIATNVTNIASNLVEIRTNSASGNTNLNNIASNLVEIRTNSASGNTNLNNIASNLVEIRANSSSGVVISGIASAGGGGSMSNFIITDGSTPQTVDDGETITFTDGTGAEFVTSATNTVTVNSVDGEIVHDNLSGFVANEHIDWTSSSAGTIHATNYTDTVYTLPEANATTKGGIELFSNTDQSVAATAVSATSARTYGLQLNSDGQGVVNVPWVDTNTTYSVGDGGLTTNDFTNTDHTKLDGIEASADVTDATNVAAAGALMDSELAGLAAVKATTGTFLTADQTKLDGIETSATADQTNAEIATAVEAASDSNTFTDADHTKLNAIEASATADQTAGEILTLLEDGIDSVHYKDGSIDNTHIADDAIDSEHYVDGSIDEAHIADDAVTSDKLAHAITAVTSLTAPLVKGSTSIQTPLIEYTDGDDAITIADGGIVTFAKATKPALKANADAATITFDVNEANVHTVTLGDNRIFAISNETAGQKFIIRILQDGTGSRTVTWFSTIKWAGGSAPTLTTDASKADVVGFLVTGTDTYDGFVIGQNI